MKRVAASDSSVVPYTGMKVYLTRVATLIARGQEKVELGWKSQRGSVEARRVEESTPLFTEMASPGTSFDGSWRERSHGGSVLKRRHPPYSRGDRWSGRGAVRCRRRR